MNPFTGEPTGPPGPTFQLRREPNYEIDCRGMKPEARLADIGCGLDSFSSTDWFGARCGSGRDRVGIRAVGVGRQCGEGCGGVGVVVRSGGGGIADIQGHVHGVLKVFLDQFAGGEGLRDVVVPVMLGAGPSHTMAPDVFLKPVLVELGATVPAPGLYLIDSTYSTDSLIADYVERWGKILLAATTTGTEAR